MKYNHIHILGASGSGTTTLGKELEKEFGFAHLDTDDFYWEPTNPPYQKGRPRTERSKLLLNALQKHSRWVVAGSLCGWGDDIIPLFDLVIYLWVPTNVRIERLQKREINRFGQEVLNPGNIIHEQYNKFINWASIYDTAGLETRSKLKHESWIKENIKCSIIRYEGKIELNEILGDLRSKIS